MNNLESVAPAVEILRKASVPFALLHCTSMYPTPYNKVRLGAIRSLAKSGSPMRWWGSAIIRCAIMRASRRWLWARSILEKHFTSDRSWPGPDVPISMDPAELRDLVEGSRAVHQALGGAKDILPEEKPTIDFAYACVVSIRDIAAGDAADDGERVGEAAGDGRDQSGAFRQRCWAKRARRALPVNAQLAWADVE